MALLESGERYLETIYILSKKSNYVRAIDIGEKMGYTKPSVSRALSRLKADGYVVSDKDGYLTLTESGMAVARTIYERHLVLTECLTLLGVDREVASQDACRIEHVISPESFEALKKHVHLQDFTQ